MTRRARTIQPNLTCLAAPAAWLPGGTKRVIAAFAPLAVNRANGASENSSSNSMNRGVRRTLSVEETTGLYLEHLGQFESLTSFFLS